MIASVFGILFGYSLVGTGVFIGLIAGNDDYDFKRPIRKQVLGWLIVTAIWLPLMLIVFWAYHVDSVNLLKGEKKNEN